MSLRSTRAVWGSAARAFHWLSAALILFGLGHGYWMTHFAAREVRFSNCMWHSLIMLYFTLLLAIRIVWRLTEKGPADPPASAAWEKGAAQLGHFALYGLMIWLVVTGYIFPARFDPKRVDETKMALFGNPVPGLHSATANELRPFWEENHIYATWAMAVLLVVHIAAAVRHHVTKGNDVLTGMTTGCERTA